MAEANFNSNVSRSKTPRKLSTADLDRICGIENPKEKRCANCNIVLSFPRSFLADSYCYCCAAMIASLMQGNYWFNVQRAAESDLLEKIIEKKLLMGGGDGEGINQ